ncbi:MAG: tetratricopeptide repeat protein [Sphingomicrobium sp.]
MRAYLHLRGACALLAVAATALGAAAPVAAQGSYSPYNETATAALARYVRAIADDPKDFASLVAAGRAALELGDAQSAAGFFARADEVNPRSFQPQAGMGAVSVLNGEPHAALPYFARAQQLGAPVASFGADRGLAFDLLGRQNEAQADYRAALGGADRDLCRARLALSLAISGDRAAALETLAPLMAKGDPAGARARAFVLALTGDSPGARVAIDAAMPGSSASLAPFLVRLGSLGPGQKAAAVNLGIFPDSGESGYAYASATLPPVVAPPAMAVAASAPQRAAPATRQLASASVPVRNQAPAPVQRSSASARKIWLQLGTASNSAALNTQFGRLKSRNEELFDGIHGYVARSADRSRLLIGPFRSASDADTFAADLESVDVNAFKWSNSDSDLIVPLGTN